MAPTIPSSRRRPRRRWRGLLLLPALALGCQGGDGLVVVTVEGAAPAATVLRVSASANGHAATPFDLPPGDAGGRPLSLPASFGIAVPAKYAGRFTVEVDAQDASGTTVGTDQGSIDVGAGQRINLTLTLTPAGDDAGVSTDMTSSCPPSVQLCDDFESGRIDPALWNAVTTHATVSVDAVHAARGSYALHVHTDAVPVGGVVPIGGGVVTRLPGPDGFRFVRAFVYIPSTPSPKRGALVGIDHPGSGDTWSLVDDDAGDLAFADSFPPARLLPSTLALPHDRWFCLSWYAGWQDGDAGAPGVFFGALVDDDMNTALYGDGNAGSLPFGTTRFGYFNPTPSPPLDAYDIWFDDVIVSDQAIPCIQ